MSAFSSAGGQQQIVITGVASPQIDNVTLNLSTTEYAVVLPSSTKRYLLKLRNSGVELKLRYVTGGDFLTVPKGCSYSEDQLSALSLTLYVQAASDGQILELVTWS